MDWQIALIVSAVVFAAFLVFKMRPAMTSGARATAAALEEARKRIESATDDRTRASALADAADACASLGRTNGAVGFYSRALRADPRSPEIVGRAARSLARRPAAIEMLMWRHLAAHPWTGEHREAAIAALRTLARVYGSRHRHHVRAHAIEHALEAIGAGSSSKDAT